MSFMVRAIFPQFRARAWRKLRFDLSHHVRLQDERRFLRGCPEKNREAADQVDQLRIWRQIGEGSCDEQKKEQKQRQQVLTMLVSTSSLQRSKGDGLMWM